MKSYMDGVGGTIREAMQNAKMQPEESTISAIEELIASINPKLTDDHKLDAMHLSWKDGCHNIWIECVINGGYRTGRYIRKFEKIDEVEFPLDVFRKMVGNDNTARKHQMYDEIDHISFATITIELPSKKFPTYFVNFYMDMKLCSRMDFDIARAYDRKRDNDRAQRRSKDAKTGSVSV